MRRAAWIFGLLLLTLASPAFAQPSLWVSRGPGAGGALYTPTLSPHQPGEVFLTCDMSGMYRTTDFGVTWALTPFSQIVGATQGCQVQFTSDPRTLYAIDYTGEVPAPTRSTDGGTTWARLATDPTDGGAFTILADPGRTDRLLLTNYSELYVSSDGGDTWNLRYSDTNGCYIAGALFVGQNIYLGTNAGVLLSTDGGSSFSLASLGGIPAGEAMVSFAGAKEGSTLRFVCVTLGSGDVWPGVTGADHGNYQGVYVLEWGQPNWVSRTSGIVAGDHPFFCGMARGEADVMYLAGGSDDGVPVVYRSATAGQSWTKVLNTTGTQNVFTGWSGYQGDREWSYGEYALGFAVSPVDPNRIVFTDLGFAHGTSDGGASWHQMYVHPSTENPSGSPTPKRHYYQGVGLENTSCWWLTWSDASHVFASFTDIRGVRSTDGGATWGFDYSGHTLNTMYHCVRHANGTLYAATSSVHDMYESTYLQDSRIDGGSGLLLFSSDGGATWQTLHNFGHPVVWLALDPGNANRMYASVVDSAQGGVFVSSDIQNGASSTWSKLANPPRTAGHPFNIRVLNDGTLLCTYSGRRDGSGAFTQSSGLFVMPSGATTWQDRSANPGMYYWTKDVVVDPGDSTQNTWYVCVFSHWGTGTPHDLGGVYRTSNRGTTWARIFPSVAQDGMRVESCTVNPSNPNEMYLTTETQGLWRTANLGSTSPTFAQAASYPFQHPLRVFYNPHVSGELWVTSFGYGMALGVLDAERSPEVSDDGAHALRAARSGSNVDIAFEDTGATRYNLYVSNSPVTHPFRVSSSLAGKKQCALTGLVPSGGGMLTLPACAIESGITGATRVLYFLVSGDAGAHTEGPLGSDSLGQEITADAFCAR